MSDFTDRVLAEAERRTRPPGISGQTLPSMEQVAERDGLRRGFEAGARWAHDVLLADPTDAEVEVVAEAVKGRLSWASLHWGVEGVHPDALPHIATAAIAAFLAERRGSE